MVVSSLMITEDNLDNVIIVDSACSRYCCLRLNLKCGMSCLTYLGSHKNGGKECVDACFVWDWESYVLRLHILDTYRPESADSQHPRKDKK